MIAAAFVLLTLAGFAFLHRLLIGPTVADRVVALDGLLMVVICGILVDVADGTSVVSIDTVLVVSVVAFIGTGVLARLVERQGG
ncbi:MAG: Na(+)/H(+) antiporter subunit [Actinomycetota bacterium]|jgi:multicomponent Na+:H+ antiporter subunit F